MYAIRSYYDPDRKLRVGVIGAGYLGKFHAEKYAAMEDVELVGVVDTEPERAAEIARKFNARPFTSHEDIFGMVDAVSVAAPTPYHFDIAKDFLKQDIDVLIEKPMTTTLEEADTLRITSYNVCYTKLLRARRMLRPRDIRAAGLSWMYRVV